MYLNIPLSCTSFQSILNFGYAPPQNLKINLIFQRIRFCCRRILPVLLSPHFLILVNIIFFFIPMVAIIMCRCVLCRRQNNSLDNTVLRTRGYLHSLIKIICVNDKQTIIIDSEINTRERYCVAQYYLHRQFKIVNV